MLRPVVRRLEQWRWLDDSSCGSADQGFAAERKTLAEVLLFAIGASRAAWGRLDTSLLAAAPQAARRRGSKPRRMRSMQLWSQLLHLTALLQDQVVCAPFQDDLRRRENKG